MSPDSFSNPRPGMGAILHDEGATFRVWAPFADSVSVAGDFNGWNRAADPLAHEGDGYWAADVGAAQAGDKYKFFLRNGAWQSDKNDPYAREMTDSNGDSVIVDPSFDWGDENGYATPPWHELVIYEMHAGTFNDVPGGGPGTFDDVIAKLDGLRDDLSVNAILLMPAAEFPLGRSLGYNPNHLFAVEREYGGPKGLKKFVRAAHERGIAVILDVVYNHIGPGDVDLKVFDGWQDPSHPDGIYFYDMGRISTPWASPRPDYGRPEVRQFIRDNALFWLSEFRLDGLRWDATNYMRTVDNDWRNIPDGWSLMQRINGEIDDRAGWKISIAEDLQNNPWITRNVSQGGAGFDSQWDAGFVHPIRRNLAVSDDGARNMHEVAAAIYHRYNADALQRIIYTESHDEVARANAKRRLPEDIWPGNADSWHAKKRSTLGAALVMTAPGIPMIFQGQEFLEDGQFDDGEPLDWRRRLAFGGITALYGDLIRLRRNWFDNTRGLRGQHVNVFHLNDRDKVVAFHRWSEGGAGDDVVVVANFANRAYPGYHVGFPRAGLWRLRLNSDSNLYDSSFGNFHSSDAWATAGAADGMPFGANVGLGPYTALILSQDRP